MKSKTSLTLAKLRKFILVTALVMTPFVAFQTGFAQPPADVATATLTSGGMTSISITGNQSFTLTLGVTTNFVSGGYTVFYQSNNGSGLFQIVARTNLQPIFGDPTTTDAVAFSGTNGILMPSNARDLGYTGDQVNNAPAGTFNLQSITINTLNAAPGTYTIFLDNRSIMTSRSGGGFFDVNMGGPSGPQFTVTVIPEPTTVGLAIMGGAALLVVARRKLRARA